MWKQLGYLLNTKNSKSKRSSVNKLIIDGKTVSNDKEIANALNSYFLNVGPNLANKVNHSSASHKDYLLNPTTDTVFLTPTDSIEISKEISSLKNKKSGIDIFKTSLIKFMKDEIIEALVIIFNKSFSEGQFPNMLKIAKVIPVFKGGESTDPNNYRPISLLSIFDKLLEKVMYKRISCFLSKHKILYKFQFGFRKNHATTHALIDVMDYIYKSLDEGKFVIGIFIDLKKAFDTVKHDILLDKLEHYGIRGITLKWFKTYLENRKQFVTTNHTESDTYNLMDFGVPQGSVLGPLLFLIFINDMQNSLSDIIIKLFADDTNCFISGYNFSEVAKTVKNELNSLMKWITANKLTINFDPKKSSYCVFSPNKKELPANYKDGLEMGGNKLCYKEFTTYLGLIVDSKLTWKLQMKELIKKITKYCSIFSKVRHFLPKECRLALYNSFIFSRLNYGIELYLNTNKSYYKNLITSQNRLLKILQFKPFKSNVNNLYLEFDVLKVEDLHYYNICCLVHKFIHHSDSLPLSISNIFVQHTSFHSYNTRYKHDLHATHINTKSYGSKTMSYKGRQYWNHLPPELKNQEKTKPFKSELKKRCLQKYID